MTIGAIIRGKRLNKGYSQEYVAKKMQVSQNHIHKIEAGKQKASVDDLKGLAILLETSILELLGVPVAQDDKVKPIAGEITNITIHHRFSEEFLDLVKKLIDKT